MTSSVRVGNDPIGRSAPSGSPPQMARRRAPEVADDRHIAHAEDHGAACLRACGDFISVISRPQRHSERNLKAVMSLAGELLQISTSKDIAVAPALASSHAGTPAPGEAPRIRRRSDAITFWRDDRGRLDPNSFVYLKRDSARRPAHPQIEAAFATGAAMNRPNMACASSGSVSSTSARLLIAVPTRTAS